MAFLAALGAGRRGRRFDAGPALAVGRRVGDDGPGAAARGAAPRGGGARADRVLALLQATPGVTSARLLTRGRARRPAAPLAGRGRRPDRDPAARGDRGAAERRRDWTKRRWPRAPSRSRPGTMLEQHDVWVGRFAVLARSLQACAGLALGGGRLRRRGGDRGGDPVGPVRPPRRDRDRARAGRDRSPTSPPALPGAPRCWPTIGAVDRRRRSPCRCWSA